MSHNMDAMSLFDNNSRDSGFVENGSCSMDIENGSCSMELVEDYIMEEFSVIEFSQESNLPSSFTNLIEKPLAYTAKPEERSTLYETPTKNIRRTLSLQNENVTPRPKRESLFLEEDNFLIKKCRLVLRDEENCENSPISIKKPFLRRSISATEESIMSAVQKSSTEPNLIGDFSKSFSLPLTKSRHSDLKAIAPNTLARLMKGEFDDKVASFKIIDCRYPYEYQGGHIEGAVNLYTKAQCSELLEKQVASEGMDKRDILIFHCEFSAERGPNLSRHLRTQDRQKNDNVYPSLCYPEIYLLEGGYKCFYEQYPQFCSPEGYKQMKHPDHEAELKHFRQKSKTWNCDVRGSKRPQKVKNFRRLMV